MFRLMDILKKYSQFYNQRSMGIHIADILISMCSGSVSANVFMQK